jgi:hypothetical protein
VKLKVLVDYKSHRAAYEKGQEIDIDEALALWLQDDAPGCFEEIVEKALDEPPADKMVKSAPKKKGRGR